MEPINTSSSPSRGVPISCLVVKLVATSESRCRLTLLIGKNFKFLIRIFTIWNSSWTSLVFPTIVVGLPWKSLNSCSMDVEEMGARVCRWNSSRVARADSFDPKFYKIIHVVNLIWRPCDVRSARLGGWIEYFIHSTDSVFAYCCVWQGGEETIVQCVVKRSE